MKRIIVLGASGSIGQSTLRCIRDFPEKFTLAGFSIAHKKEIALKLLSEFPKAKYLEGPMSEAESKLSSFLASCEADLVVNGISGAAGLKASIACIEAGMDLALANKESIVLAGPLLQSLARAKNARIIPVDSEHSAVFCLVGALGEREIERIILTASGGPFRKFAKADLARVRVEDALKHPTWSMGGKISIDSATLANKALEVIEAVHLFKVSPNRITVVVHPESLVHSMVQVVSGQVYAQISPPDMRHPILYALEYPQSPNPYLAPLDFTKSLSLNFEPPRYEDFPLLGMGFQVAEKGGAYPIAFNAANEVAVEAFFKGACGFLDIANLVEAVLQADWQVRVNSFEEVFALDQKARNLCLTNLKLATIVHN